MASPDAGGAQGEDPDRVLQRVEDRVRQVQHLEPFHFSRREDGRFQCELEKPLADLDPEELRHALDVLEGVTGALRRQLEATEDG